ncbi:MAG: hypothetical protein QM751_06630 [Paludibacteraceae bacterium]
MKNKKSFFGRFRKQNMNQDIKLMKGNEAIAHAAVRAGCDGYFGYPITPQSEIMETLDRFGAGTLRVLWYYKLKAKWLLLIWIWRRRMWKTFNDSSSSPGMSLMMEGVSYIAGAELPCVLVNVMRGGPGLGTIQPSQADYFQTVKGGGHGDYKMITLAPASVQEMADFTVLAFDLAFKYRIAAVILADGIIGQMMEKVVLPSFRPRWTEEEIRKISPWGNYRKGSRQKTKRRCCSDFIVFPY